MSDEITQRFEKLKANIAHLEHQVEQLNEVIIGQGKVIDSLRRQSHQQATTLESIELERIKATNPKPPHYQ